MTNHPNRSKRSDAPGRTPQPDEIIAAREAAGLTQPEASALIHTARGSWQQWESGERRMHPAFFELFQLKVKNLR